MWRVGVDVGGTFTDLFGWDDATGVRVTAKVLTTKHDRSLGVLAAVERAEIPFPQISHFLHGTTTATNALIERSYPDVALVTTEGFRDTIEIGRQHRRYLYDPYQTKPRPIVKRRYRFPVAERMSARGERLRPLDEAGAREVARRIGRLGLRSVAVAFINSYVDPSHERRMREILAEEVPQAWVVLSAETRPVFREQGRFSTTAIRAAVMPVMVEYLDWLERGLAAHGFRGRLLILKSNGGVMGVSLAKEHPEELIESGPAGGVAYAAYLSAGTGFPNVIHTDMGGTSFDASIVEKGKGLITHAYELEWEVPLIVPMLDIHSVGAGGGSIGWIDEGGSLRMGPRSAGSDPGPACYGRGGTEATITDANLILGRLEPTLGNKFPLDRDAAERAVERLAARIGLSTLETAEGMIRISSETMAQAVKMVLVARGRDPRDFVLASFGGAGPMHACGIAEALSIPKVLIPTYAGVASAFGATAMDLRQDVEAFFYAPVEEVDLERLNAVFADLEERARSLLAEDGVPPERMEVSRTAQMRYVGQTYEVETPVPSRRIGPAELARIVEEFHRHHELEYGVSSQDFAPAFVSLGVTGTGHMVRPPAAESPSSGQSDEARKGERPVHFSGEWLRSAIYDGDRLPAGATLAGPAIVEYAHACATLPPRTRGTVDRFGNLVIDVAG
jgi:N-methylhydantoinase A